MERDFKGIWIPKEIWLSDKLTMLEKVIYAEIDSLDCDNHCIANNEYLAKFCQCSESGVSKAISHLIELGFIEQVSFNGRTRILQSAKGRLVKFARQTSKICNADSQNLLGDINNTKSYNNNTKKDKINNKIDYNIHTVSALQKFDEFWSAYPKKVNKKGAFRTFCTIKNLDKEFPLMLAAIQKSKLSYDWQKNNGQFIPHPQTWLNQERWKDVQDSVGVDRNNPEFYKDELPF